MPLFCRVFLLFVAFTWSSSATISTTTALYASPGVALYGQPVILIAAVSPATATGKVTFYDGVTMLGVGVLSDGRALFTTSLLRAPQALPSAYYNGDATYTPSRSRQVGFRITTTSASAFSRPGFVPFFGLHGSVAVGDFNRDGCIDFAIADDSGYAAVTVFLGNGNGGFTRSSGSPFGLGINAVSIDTGDFNGDGITDLVVSETWPSNNLVIFLGDGTGNFTARPVNPSETAGSFSRVSVADFNGDGKADLALANAYLSQVTLFFGDGSGQFTAGPAINYAGSGVLSPAIAAGDFNGDGRADLVVASYEGHVTVFLGDGTGGLSTAPGSPFTFGTGLSSIAIADFNMDGAADLAIADVNGGVGVFLGNGTGAFTAARGNPFAAGPTPVALAVADFDGDGKLDLAVISQNATYGQTLMGDGAGGFKAGGTFEHGETFSGALAATDFNGDGRADLVLVGTAHADVLLGVSSISTTTLAASPNPATFGQQVNLSASVNPASSNANVAFYDGPALLGQSPIISGNATLRTASLSTGLHSVHASYPGETGVSGSVSNTVALQVNAKAATSFVPGAGYTSTLTLGPRAIAAADFNGDGNTDLAVVNAGTGDVSVLLGDGAGGFATAPGSPLSAGLYPYSVAVADFNGDGKPDLAVVDSGGGAMIAFLGNGHGGFSPSPKGPFPTGTGPFQVVAADFNADGNADVAIANLGSNDITILLGDGTGGFTPSSDSPRNVGRHPVSLAVADFVGEGRSGLAVVSEDDNDVLILEGNGDGRFTNSQFGPFTLGKHPFYVAAGDVNGDGKPDLVAANTDSGDVSILLGQGFGAFVPAASSPIRVGGSPSSIALADFNGDGKLDFAVTDSSLNNKVAFYLGDGAGGFTPAKGSPYATGLGPVSLAVADFNNDGIVDVAIANINDGINVLLGSNRLGFFLVNPCRVVDTRASQGKTGSFGPPALAPNVGRDFELPLSACGLPSAQAYSLNLTAVPPGPLDFLSVWSSGQPYPGVSTLNSPAGVTLANAAFVPANANGAVTAVAGEATNLIIDANGYFAGPDGNELAFYPIRPCRVVDTRPGQGKTGPFGAPALAAYSRRDFPIPYGSCRILATTPQVYSLNVTVVPQGRLDFLSTWPAGQPYPGVSTLNSTNGSIVANAAIVAAGTGSGISVVAGNATDLIIDINGYFAPPGDQGALYYHPVAPCRLLDTRPEQGKPAPFGPPALAPYTGRNVPIAASSCGIPSGAKAYALNMTVVPQGPLAFLSTWPAGQPYPGVSTLNSPKGTTIAAAAVVPAGDNGAITVLAGNATDLIIDINGYFAP